MKMEKKHETGDDTRMNPWLAIWFHPRQAIRQVIDHNPRYFVLPLAMGAGAVEWVVQSFGWGAAFKSFAIHPQSFQNLFNLEIKLYPLFQ